MLVSVNRGSSSEDEETFGLNYSSGVTLVAILLLTIFLQSFSEKLRQSVMIWLFLYLFGYIGVYCAMTTAVETALTQHILTKLHDCELKNCVCYGRVWKAMEEILFFSRLLSTGVSLILALAFCFSYALSHVVFPTILLPLILTFFIVGKRRDSCRQPYWHILE